MASTPDRIFFDANVLLDSALKRPGKARADVRLHAAKGRAYISALSAHLFVYFAQKDIEMDVLEQFLAEFHILPITAASVDWAFKHQRNRDFEDALQIASSLDGNCTEFVTFDAALAKRYASLPGITITRL